MESKSTNSPKSEATHLGIFKIALQEHTENLAKVNARLFRLHEKFYGPRLEHEKTNEKTKEPLGLIEEYEALISKMTTSIDTLNQIINSLENAI